MIKRYTNQQILYSCILLDVDLQIGLLEGTAWRMPQEEWLPCFSPLSHMLNHREYDEQESSFTSCLVIFHPHPGNGSPSDPIGHGASRPGTPYTQSPDTQDSFRYRK